MFHCFATITSYDSMPCGLTGLGKQVGVRVSNKLEKLHQQLQQRILVLDGGMGTMIQSYRLDESDFAVERYVV